MSQPHFQQHPVLAAMCALDGALAEVAEVDPICMATDEKAAALLELSSLIDRVEELRMRVLAAASDVADQEDARDAAASLEHRGRRDRGGCRRASPVPPEDVDGTARQFSPAAGPGRA